jgi:hypothetical protein
VECRQNFFGDNPAKFLSRIHVESMWSLLGLQLLHLDNMDSTSEHREILIHPARLHMESSHCYYIIL